MRTALVLAATLAFASGCYIVPGPGPGPGSSDGTMTIDNESSYALTEVRITTVRSSSWGPNLLGGVLIPGDRLTVAVACNTYDVLIVDQYNRDCTLSSIDLCFSDQLWVVDNSTLRNCAF